MIYSLVDWTLGAWHWATATNLQPHRLRPSWSFGTVWSQARGREVLYGVVGAQDVRIRMWGICQMMSRHMVKHHQTANKIERWWENMRDVQNLIQRLSHKMNQNDKSCAKLWPLFWEIRGVRFLAESHAFQISIYTSSLPGKITRRRTPHPESWSDHFGPFGTYLDYYQRVGLGPTGCQWGFAETCVASHCGWVAGGPQMQGISEKVCGDPLGPKPNSIRKH